MRCQAELRRHWRAYGRETPAYGRETHLVVLDHLRYHLTIIATPHAHHLFTHLDGWHRMGPGGQPPHWWATCAAAPRASSSPWHMTLPVFLCRRPLLDYSGVSLHLLRARLVPTKRLPRIIPNWIVYHYTSFDGLKLFFVDSWINE